MIPAYTLTVIIMMLLSLALNWRYNPKFKSSAFLLITLVAIMAQLIMDNLTVWRGFWFFNEIHSIGVKVPFIPIENVGFGLALCWFVVLFFEIFSKKMNH